MTREEIIKASRDYAMNKSNENNTWFVDYKDIEEAFFEGAKFACNSAEARFHVGVDLACDNEDTFVTNKFKVKHSKKRNKVKFYVAMDRYCSLWLYIGKPTKIKDDFMAGYQCRAIAGEDCFSEFGLDANDYVNLKWEDEPVEVFVNMED